MTTTDVALLVRRTDPLDDGEAERWAASPAARAILAGVVASQARVEPPAQRRRRPVRVLATVVVVGAASTATAFATGLLGGPAPDRVKEHLAELDRGMPADLRYNPDLDHARAVAATASGALYLADTDDGGYCLEVVSGTDRPRGATCVPGTELAAHPLEVTAPIPDGDASPLLVGGRANDDGIATVRATYADGTSTTVPFGLDRSWLLEVPARHQSSALADGIVISGVDSDGTTVARAAVPALRDDDPTGTKHDAEQPIVATTRSDGDDLSLVLGVEGRVNLPGPVRLTLRYPDGTTVPVPLTDNGSFRLLLPTSRQDDFATRAGALVATRHGAVVATTPIASVAYWRGHTG
jgi:hypothetical protein